MEKGCPGSYLRRLLLFILLMFSYTVYAGADTGILSPTAPQPFSTAGPLSRTGPLSAVSLSSGGALYPPRYEWKSISTPHNLLIFPVDRADSAGQETTALQAAAEVSAAQEAAAAVTAAWGPVSSDFGIDLKPYPLVLNTSLDVANGYFGLAPRKSEWYSYPPQQQFGGGADWYTLLAFHEGRHAAQFSAMDQGFIRWAHVLAGEYGWTGLSFYAFPLWYFEGDAILSETAFTGAGRGRNAAFHREIRAIAREGDFPSYQQAYLGSFKTHFPDFYHLGYPLVAYIRMMYGGDAWNEIIRETARFAFWPLRFHRAVKKVTGRSVPELYRESLEFLGNYWVRQSGQDGQDIQDGQDYPAGFEYLTPETKDWTNFYPVASNGTGQIYVMVEGDRRPVELVLMDFSRDVGSDEGAWTFSQNRLFFLSARDDWLDIAGEKAVWAETIPHPLWTNVSSSDLIILDLQDGDRRRLTRGKHLQAPVFSPDGRRIAAIEVQPGGRSSLVILDADPKHSEPPHFTEIAGAAPAFTDIFDGLYLRHPVWSGDGGRIAVVGSSKGKSGLFEYDAKEDIWRLLYGPVEENLASPRYWNGYLLYTSDYSGREAIYALDTDTGEIFQVAEGRIATVRPLIIAGLEQEVPDRDGRARLLFSDYGPAGFRLAWTSLDENSFIPVENVKRNPVNYAEELAAELNGQIHQRMEPKGDSDFDAETAPGETQGPSEEYPVETYHPAAHLFNFHSWGLLPDGEGRVELFAQSDDPIGLLSLRTFTGINPLEESYDLGFQGTYRGAFPIIHFGLSGDVNYPGDPDLEYYGYTGLLGLEAPLNLRRGIWQRELSLETAAYIRGENSGPIGSDDGMDVVLPVRYSLSFYNGSTAVAPADFTPPWGQYTRWSLYHVPLQEEYRGWRLEQRSDLVFPGLFRQHSLALGIDAEWNQGEEVPLSITPIRPTGYLPDWNDGYPGDIVADLAYTLPLCSPDMAIGNIYYLKRILLTLFSDVGIGGEDAGAFTQNTSLEYYPSSGVELMGEQNFFNLPVTVQAGIRLIYRWRDETFRVEETLFTLGFEWK